MSVSTNVAAPRLYWDTKRAIQHSCPICQYMLRDDRDFEMSKKVGTCAECADIYYYPNAEAWEAGWRPTLQRKDT